MVDVVGDSAQRESEAKTADRGAIDHVGQRVGAGALVVGSRCGETLAQQRERVESTFEREPGDFADEVRRHRAPKRDCRSLAMMLESDLTGKWKPFRAPPYDAPFEIGRVQDSLLAKVTDQGPGDTLRETYEHGDLGRDALACLLPAAIRTSPTQLVKRAGDESESPISFVVTADVHETEVGVGEHAQCRMPPDHPIQSIVLR